MNSLGLSTRSALVRAAETGLRRERFTRRMHDSAAIFAVLRHRHRRVPPGATHRAGAVSMRYAAPIIAAGAGVILLTYGVATALYAALHAIAAAFGGAA